MTATKRINPFPFIIILILMILSTYLLSKNASAASSEGFCTTEQVQNFEEMGIDDKQNFYFMLDGKIYVVGSWYDNPIYFDTNDDVIYTNIEHMTVSNYNENGHLMVDGYAERIELNKYNEYCVLAIPTDNKLIINGSPYVSGLVPEPTPYDKCNYDGSYWTVPCYILNYFGQVFEYVHTNFPIIYIAEAAFLIGVGLLLFIKIRGVL